MVNYSKEEKRRALFIAQMILEDYSMSKLNFNYPTEVKCNIDYFRNVDITDELLNWALKSENAEFEVEYWWTSELCVFYKVYHNI